MAVILGLGAGVMLILGALGDRLARIATADSVADNVALAAAADPTENSAETLAELNRFELLSVQRQPAGQNQCRIEVEVRESQELANRHSDFLARLIHNTLVSSKATAISSHPCA